MRSDDLGQIFVIVKATELSPEWSLPLSSTKPYHLFELIVSQLSSLFQFTLTAGNCFSLSHLVLLLSTKRTQLEGNW